MDSDKYSSLLLESSFKESNLFWIRNGAFSLFQTILIGIFISNTVPDSNGKTISYCLGMILCIAGIIFGILHLLVLCVSRKYNQIWFNSLFSFVEKQRKKTITEESIWGDFKIPLKAHREIKLDTSTITLALPVLFIIAWFLFIFLICPSLLVVGTTSANTV